MRKGRDLADPPLVTQRRKQLLIETAISDGRGDVRARDAWRAPERDERPDDDAQPRDGSCDDERWTASPRDAPAPCDDGPSLFSSLPFHFLRTSKVTDARNGRRCRFV
jgi:hypothetical protein